MSHIALYRRLRPQKFADVIGQEHIITTLQNQIKAKRISHAYLLSGTRGTGKTSTAKIFAKAINCSALADGEPCGICQSCEAIGSGFSVNAIEIDAASNNGVDNIREIREEVRYPPTMGYYKVYIIDEVHMLSTGAFNALLKTLEEPPAHVVFILATTDPQKLPATILSRCQRYDFHRITTETMAETLAQYAALENIKATPGALRFISQQSDGAMRDALSILDQSRAFYDNQEITLEKVQEVVGAVDNTVLFDMADAFMANDSGRCLHIIDDIIIKGRDISQFIHEMIHHFRNLMVAASVGHESYALDYSLETIQKLQTQVASVNQNTLIGWVKTFSELVGQMRYAPNERVLLEVTCIRLCHSETTSVHPAMLERLERLEKLVADGVPEKKK